MFNKTTRNVAALLFAFGTALTGFTPLKGDDTVQNPPAPAGIKIDGSLSEWGGLVTKYDEATRLYYAVSNDSQNLYLAVRSESKQDLAKIALSGITLSVNTDGKKKEGASATFPIISRQRSQGSNADSILKQRITSAKEIRIRGFKQLPDGGISVANDYGIIAAASLNDNRHFIYELAIPLKHLDLTAADPRPIAIQIKYNRANPAPAQSFSTGMGGYGRWRSAPSRNEPEGFWIKRTLRDK
ncbi:MAG TPA: hypothetical protein VGE26_06270 [Sphingobacteriaceae bacterium]